MNVIETHRLSKKFGDFNAVNEVSFCVRQGEVFGFLGPNGAGKTTTMHVLSTLLRPSSGSVRINGFDVSEQDRVRESIGMIFQETTLDQRLTSRENLKFHAMLYDVPESLRKSRTVELLKMVDLEEHIDRPVSTFSGGMKRRLEIVRGLLHHPQVLFLDEPTIGLDPQTRRHIWDYLLKLRAQEGMTMFMTTHYMDEAEHCDHIAIIDKGRIVALDTPKALKATVGGDVVTVVTTDNAEAARKLADVPGIVTRAENENDLTILTPRGDQFVPELIARLSQGERTIEVRSVSVSRPTLEDVFIKVTGHGIRAQDADPLHSFRMGVRMWNKQPR